MKHLFPVLLGLLLFAATPARPQISTPGGSLQVTITPAGAIAAGAQWRVDGGTWQTNGATVSGLPVTNHAVSFNTISGWTTPSNQTVSIKANSVAKAQGNYVFSAQGIYNGLFAQANTNVTSSGMLSGLDVTASGTYTGKLLIGGSTNAISGGFDASGKASNYVKRASAQGGPLTLEITVNWNDSPPDITGTVSGTNGGAWTANLTNELATNGPGSAAYTAWLLPAVGAPPGYGCILITNNAGDVTLSVTLADGTSFTQNVPVSGAGELPVYGNLYKSTGLLAGNLSLESGLPTGSLTWIKKASSSGLLYTNGFTNVVVVQGSLWTNPPPRTAAMDMPSGQLVISGGGLASNLTFNVSVSSNNTLVKLTKTPTNTLTGQINPKTGQLTVTFGNGAGTATTTGTGAGLQNTNIAAGFFLGKTNAGVIVLKPGSGAPTTQTQFSYTTNGGAITITGYTGSGGSVTIPAAINGLPVTTIAGDAFEWNATLTSVTIPSSVACIESNAFLECAKLARVTISAGVSNIGTGAFWGCASLTNVTIPGSVTNIGDYAFNDCIKLTNATIGVGIASIGEGAFGGCALANIAIPGSVTNIGESAFAYSALGKVAISNGVVSIGNDAFNNCTSLVSVTIPGSVTHIGDSAFAYCFALTNIVIPASVSNIANFAFAYCSSLTNVTISNGVASIGDSAFTGCYALGSVTIPASVTNMGNAVFQDCIKLTNAILPDSIASIGNDEFMDCFLLAGVAIPAGVTNIGEDAFAGCGLASVAIPGGVNHIGEGAFAYCSRLKAITVDPLNSFYSSLDGVLYNPGQTILIQYPGGLSGSYTISNGVASIGAEAFSGCGLTNVTIPASVTNMGGSAFSGCAGLTNVYFEGNAPAADSTVFSLDINATAYYLPDTTGWSSAFAGIPAVLLNPFAGSLKVNVYPPSAVKAGAEWQVDGGTWQTNGATVGNLSVSNHTLSFNTISGWTTPSNQIISIGSNAAVTAGGTYVVSPPSGSLQVTITPAGAIAAGAQWQVDGSALQDSGATVSGLWVTNHTLSFNTISGWTTPASQTIAIKANSVAKAKGNYVFSAQGIYNGLFAQAETNVTSSGMLSGLNVTASGTYTGKLLIGGSTNAISGGFDASGKATNQVPRAAAKGGPLTLEMTLHWNDSPPDVTGTVSGTNGGSWTANLTNELAVTESNSAEYTALVATGGTPPGYGYVLMTNDAGAVTLSVTLADGTSFTQNVPVSGAGNLPVYGNLYNSTGVLLGWIGLDGGLWSGNLAWIKPASSSSVLYTNGFTNMVSAQGSLWTNPPPHVAAIDLPSGQLEIIGGGLASNLIFDVSVSASNTLVKLGGATNTLTGQINPKTGQLTVTFGNGAGTATTTGTGVALQNANSAVGFFVGKTNSGLILLQP